MTPRIPITNKLLSRLTAKNIKYRLVSEYSGMDTVEVFKYQSKMYGENPGANTQVISTQSLCVVITASTTPEHMMGIEQQILEFWK